MKSRLASGITLVELLIAIAIVGILAAIAVPTYGAYIERAHRAEGKARLLEAAQWLERHRAERGGVYTGASLPAGLRTSPTSGKVMYDLSVQVTDTTYLLSAVPRSRTAVAAANGCGTLTIAQDGLRTAAGNSSAATIERCWGR